MKTNAIIRIVLWSIVLVILLGILATALSLRIYQKEYTYADLASVTPIESCIVAITELDISWASGTVTIEPGDVNGILLEETPVSNEAYAMVTSYDSEKLTVKYQNKSANQILGSNLNKSLKVTFPRNWTGKKIEIKNASADLILRDLTLEEVEIDTTSGSCTLENCVIVQTDFDSVSGSLEYTGKLWELEAETVSGNLTAQLEETPISVDVKTVSGVLDLTLPESTGFTAKLDSRSGQFTSDFDTTTQNDRYLCGDGACEITVRTTSGDVRIQKP